MDLTVWESNRFCAVEPRRSLALPAIKKDILQGRCVRDAFTVLATPAPARDQTWFKVCTKGKDLLVAIAVFETSPPTSRSMERPSPLRDSIELFFDLRHDHLGYYQFCFNPDGSLTELDHQPYVETHSTAHRPLRVQRFAWDQDKENRSHRLHWLFVWFRSDDVFARGPLCGFNIARYNPAQEENSTWNHASGCGFQDAWSFGHLAITPPDAVVHDVRARLDAGTLRLSGRLGAGAAATPHLTFELADPLDNRRPVDVRVDPGHFEANVDLGAAPPCGRYRLYPRLASQPAAAVEPVYLAVDLPAPGTERARAFNVAITYDVIDNMCRNFYTPARLEQEIANFKAWGVSRLDWIEHGPFESNVSLWNSGQFGIGARNSYKHVPDTFKEACTLAHKHGVKIYAVYKTFDLGFNHWPVPPRKGLTVQDLGNWTCAVVPELGKHQEWTMQAHPQWLRQPNLPVTKLCFYSQEPVARIAPNRISVWTSTDNRKFTRSRGRIVVKQGKVRRARYQWTPAGKLADKDAWTSEWLLEISGLSLHQPYAAVRIDGKPTGIAHRMFALVEAMGADGWEGAVFPSTSGSMAQGFAFGDGWSGWANYTQPMLQTVRWPGGDGALGLAFADRPNLPTLLEPAFEGAHDIWLARFKHMLDSGADGIDIRTLCHHTGSAHYLLHAYAQPVRDAFRAETGRDVESTPEDARLIRLIRGRFYTQFLRKAKALAAAAGKKLVIHFETGMEVPPELDQRMEINFEWETWIREKIVDEVSLKQWCAHSPLIHERLLPLARRSGVGVQITSRCLPGGLDVRAMEIAPRLATEAFAAGFDGYSYYEAGELQRMNREGLPMSVGHAEPAIRAARAAVDAMAR